MAALTKTTRVFANHGLPLECDILEAGDYPGDGPVFLFFHSGGLAGGARQAIPPWLVQVCFRRKWPIISPSYRLLPQAKAPGLLDDVTAAYRFARSWGGGSRDVIVGGASAGFFMAALTAHHLSPKPRALLSITGIPTFRHPFFASSILLTPEPLTESDMEKHLRGPLVVGTPEAHDPTVFTTDKLLPSGEKNHDFQAPKADPPETSSDVWPRGCLYDYWLYHNLFADLVGEIDPGFGSKEGPARDAAQNWPQTVIIQGDDDYDVSMDVSVHMVDSLGEEKVSLFLADSQGHLFESTSFLEDESPQMDTVRSAIARLDDIVASSG